MFLNLEIVPTTPAGYITGSACAITGVIFVALQVPVIANKFNALYTYACDQQMRQQWLKEQALEQAANPGTKGQNQNGIQKQSTGNLVIDFKRQLQTMPAYFTPSSFDVGNNSKNK